MEYSIKTIELNKLIQGNTYNGILNYCNLLVTINGEIVFKATTTAGIRGSKNVMVEYINGKISIK